MSGIIGLDSSIMGGEVERGAELKRYMFAVELNGTIGTKTEKGSEKTSTFTWKADEAACMFKKVPLGSDEFDAIRQTLVIRKIILGPAAKEGESNWLVVDVIDPDGSDTKFPLAHLSKGQETQAIVDLAFPDSKDVSVKFTLEEGTGPVHIIGYHLIERIQFDNQEECEEDEDMGEEEQEEDADEETDKDVKAQVIRVAKRRINAENKNGDTKVKKAKTGDEEEEMEDEVVTNGSAKK